MLNVIRSFRDRGTSDLYRGIASRAARAVCPISLWPVAQRKLDYLDAAVVLDDLRVPPGNRLEPLKGSRSGQHSIRINEQYRICFIWAESGPDRVEIVDYH